MHHEADPIPKFGTNPMKIVKLFNSNTEKLNSILKSSYKISDIIKNFTKQDSSYLEYLRKTLMVKLPSEERKFVLTPIVARYNDLSNEVHQLQTIIEENKEINHIFVNPIAGVEGFFYNYLLYIPIPKDLLINEPKNLLKEHWNLISDTFSNKF
jgi:hypothetical protein